MPTGVYVRSEEDNLAMGESLKKAYREGRKTGFKKGEKTKIWNGFTSPLTAWNKGKPWSEEVLKKLRCKRPKAAGENNHKWVGGTHRYWINKCFERDNFTCQDCKIQFLEKGLLDVHHLKSKSRYPELKFDVNNGITLCPNCHRVRTLQQRKVNFN